MRRPGIEPGSPSWQPGILTTILAALSIEKLCSMYNFSMYHYI